MPLPFCKYEIWTSNCITIFTINPNPESSDGATQQMQWIAETVISTIPMWNYPTQNGQRYNAQAILATQIKVTEFYKYYWHTCSGSAGYVHMVYLSLTLAILRTFSASPSSCLRIATIVSCRIAIGSTE